MGKEIAKKTSSNITDKVLNKINLLQSSGGIHLPKGYSPANALKVSYLILSELKDKNKKPVLESCSQESIANSLLYLVINGLNPYKHGSFIAYDGILNFTPEYTANIFLAKRDADVTEVKGVAIFEKDTFKYEIKSGISEILEHKQTLESRSTKVIGAYCIVEFKNGSRHTEIMNINEIHNAWNQGYSYKTGKSKVHNTFADQMAEKTVINRALKRFVKTSVENTDSKTETQDVEENTEIIDIKNIDNVKVDKPHTVDIQDVEEVVEEKTLKADF